MTSAHVAASLMHLAQLRRSSTAQWGSEDDAFGGALLQLLRPALAVLPARVFAGVCDSTVSLCLASEPRHGAWVAAAVAAARSRLTVEAGAGASAAPSDAGHLRGALAALQPFLHAAGGQQPAAPAPPAPAAHSAEREREHGSKLVAAAGAEAVPEEGVDGGERDAPALEEGAPPAQRAGGAPAAQAYVAADDAYDPVLGMFDAVVQGAVDAPAAPAAPPPQRQQEHAPPPPPPPPPLQQAPQQQLQAPQQQQQAPLPPPQQQQWHGPAPPPPQHGSTASCARPPADAAPPPRPAAAPSVPRQAAPGGERPGGGKDASSGAPARASTRRASPPPPPPPNATAPPEASSARSPDEPAQLAFAAAALQALSGGGQGAPAGTEAGVEGVVGGGGGGGGDDAAYRALADRFAAVVAARGKAADAVAGVEEEEGEGAGAVEAPRVEEHAEAVATEAEAAGASDGARVDWGRGLVQDASWVDLQEGGAGARASSAARAPPAADAVPAAAAGVEAEAAEASAAAEAEAADAAATAAGTPPPERLEPLPDRAAALATLALFATTNGGGASSDDDGSGSGPAPTRAEAEAACNAAAVALAACCAQGESATGGALPARGGARGGKAGKQQQQQQQLLSDADVAELALRLPRLLERLEAPGMDTGSEGRPSAVAAPAAAAAADAPAAAADAAAPEPAPTPGASAKRERRSGSSTGGGSAAAAAARAGLARGLARAALGSGRWRLLSPRALAAALAAACASPGEATQQAAQAQGTGRAAGVTSGGKARRAAAAAVPPPPPQQQDDHDDQPTRDARAASASGLSTFIPDAVEQRATLEALRPYLPALDARALAALATGLGGGGGGGASAEGLLGDAWAGAFAAAAAEPEVGSSGGSGGGGGGGPSRLSHLSVRQLSDVVGLLVPPAGAHANRAARAAAARAPPPPPQFLAAAAAAATDLLVAQMAPTAPPTTTAALLSLLSLLETLLGADGLCCGATAPLARALATGPFLTQLATLPARALAPARRVRVACLLAAARVRPRPQALHALLGPLSGAIATTAGNTTGNSRNTSASSSSSGNSSSSSSKLPVGDVARLLWACAELQMAPTAALLAEVLEATSDAMEGVVCSGGTSGSGGSEGKLTAGSLALLARSLLQLGVVPDSGWQACTPIDTSSRTYINSTIRAMHLCSVYVATRPKARYHVASAALLPSACFEELSLLAFATLHFGRQPPPEWTRRVLLESHAKMDAADAPSLVRLSHFIATLYEAHASAAMSPSPAGERPPPLPPIPGEWMTALLSASSALLHTYDPPELLALQLRSLAGLRWLPPSLYLSEVLAQLDVALSAGDLSPAGRIAALTALTVLGNATVSEGGDTGERAAAARFAHRCVLSASFSAEQFLPHELGCLLCEVLPRLCAEDGLLSDSPSVVSNRQPLRASGGQRDLREALRTLSRAFERAQEEEGGEGPEGGGSLAAALAEYVSPAVLEPCLRLRE
ncbi:hypothetical protein FOA52_002002 [Chlamydomonas sp. UWO 241]|nr:hypothetical protein FOA52_002002 [Chlamydomonas sp. UWO 241]